MKIEISKTESILILTALQELINSDRNQRDKAMAECLRERIMQEVCFNITTYKTEVIE